MAIQQQHGANRPSYPVNNTAGGTRRGPQQFGGNNANGGRGNRGRVSRDPRDQGPRRNDRIRVPEVRVIDPDGQQAGLMDIADALQRARGFGLDLVEIAPNARPPVCRIVDYGKYLYEEAKRQRKAKAATVKMKEVKLRPRCDEHDLMIKIRRAENFLFHGHKIKLTLSFRFREMEHPSVGHDLVRRALALLAHIATADHPPRQAGRSINTILTPVSQAKRKLLHNTSAQPIADDDEDDDDDDEGEDNDGDNGDDANDNDGDNNGKPASGNTHEN
ncbi:MAG: translation initiation factor IF-3 [Puniceicoccales bacterium]|jgi:translation initiation factor IF-3|nr:translation initiation factor IF-3 [Puniceicoccales bacterium]